MVKIIISIPSFLCKHYNLSRNFFLIDKLLDKISRRNLSKRDKFLEEKVSSAYIVPTELPFDAALALSNRNHKPLIQIPKELCIYSFSTKYYINSPDKNKLHKPYFVKKQLTTPQLIEVCSIYVNK